MFETCPACGCPSKGNVMHPDCAAQVSADLDNGPAYSAEVDALRAAVVVDINNGDETTTLFAFVEFNADLLSEADLLALDTLPVGASCVVGVDCFGLKYTVTRAS